MKLGIFTFELPTCEKRFLFCLQLHHANQLLRSFLPSNALLRFRMIVNVKGYKKIFHSSTREFYIRSV
ncbi:CLUMA_CG002868, isoform A [Clunio marinus]|uniref:CLUMA_CG002868, isoform A n=1 Tax=Clunio marinus TaxID=568069 RepID=A0A1J1HNF7_9DIPT|nr:CLUMA_CG002868, isoform A [Clunio marinus]